MPWMAERRLDEGDSFSSDAVTRRLPGTASGRRLARRWPSRYDRPGACRQDLKNPSIEHLDDLRAKAKYARERRYQCGGVRADARPGARSATRLTSISSKETRCTSHAKPVFSIIEMSHQVGSSCHRCKPCLADLGKA